MKSDWLEKPLKVLKVDGKPWRIYSELYANGNEFVKSSK